MLPRLSMSHGKQLASSALDLNALLTIVVVDDLSKWSTTSQLVLHAELEELNSDLTTQSLFVIPLSNATCFVIFLCQIACLRSAAAKHECIGPLGLPIHTSQSGSRLVIQLRVCAI